MTKLRWYPRPPKADGVGRRGRGRKTRMHTLKSKFIGCGSYVPPTVVTNHDLAKLVDTTDHWIRERTGIKERRVTSGEKTSDVAIKAAKFALKASGLNPKDIDLVITGTVTPDMVFPSVSCLVQNELGLTPGIPAFDVSAACSGFLFAVDIADKYIKSGTVKNALVIGVDLFSTIVDWKDRSTCVLFGDGAGAAILGASHGKSGILSSRIHSDGRYWEMLYAPGKFSCGSTPLRVQQKIRLLKPRPPYLKMKGNETFKIAVAHNGTGDKGSPLGQRAYGSSDVSLLIPHQANMRIINAIRERLLLPEEKVFTNLEKYGNTSAGSIPIALDEAE